MTRRTNSRRADCVSGGSGPAGCDRAGEPGHDFGRQAREKRSRATPGAAEIGPGENDAGADDAGTDLARPSDGEREGRVRLHPPVAPSRSPATIAAV